MTKRDHTMDHRAYSRLLACVALLVGTQAVNAQQSIVDGKTNLIVNGGAEAGPASPDGTTAVSSIPNWTRATGHANVLPYGLTGSILLSDEAPPDHGFNYFAKNTNDGAATLTQIVDVSSAASLIAAGNVKFTASAYLGNTRCCQTTQVTFAFQNTNGQSFSTATLSQDALADPGVALQQQIGLVPSGTTRVLVTISFGFFSAADSLSLVLSPLGTNPSSVLGTNLIVNGGAEAGPSAPRGSTAPYIPGWSTSDEVSVAPYGGTGWIGLSDPGPADRGVNLFSSGTAGSNMYQDIDVSAAASLIDSGQVTYQVSAWLGGLAGSSSPILTYTFYDWSDPPNQLAPTAQLASTGRSAVGLDEESHIDKFPPHTRRVRVAVAYSVDTLADNIEFTLAAPPGPPVIDPGGIVSAGAFGGFTSIAPGSWIEIYGSDLAPVTQGWAATDFVNNVAPTSLGGVSVSIGGQAAFLDYISPGQVNAQVPSNVSTGTVPVTVTNANGTSDQFWLYVNSTEPGLLAPASFVIGGKQYVAALFSDGQTFALPVNAIPNVPSRPANPGDTLTIYGVGFGPVTNGFTAGAIVTAQNSLVAPIQFFFNATAVTPSYYGLAPSFVGLYQFNVTVPAVSANSVLPLSFTLGGVKGSQTLYIAVN
jgi:uncharacterized protein (TIGR03437 family)